MKKLNWVLVFLLMLAVACTSKEPPKTAAAKQTEAKPVAANNNPVPPAAIAQNDEVEFQNTDLQVLLPPYIQLKDALVQGNTLQAKRATLALKEGIRVLPAMKQLEPVLSGILQTADIEQQRNRFAIFSEQLIGKIEQKGLKKGKIYIAHCPMAMNDKGAYWITQKKEIQNPYFGSAMLNCGSIDKTIE